MLWARKNSEQNSTRYSPRLLDSTPRNAPRVGCPLDALGVDVRFWEIGIAFGITFFIVWRALTPRATRVFGYLGAVITAGSVYQHLVVEGLRWQMALLYAAAFVVIVATFWEILSPDEPMAGRMRALGLAVVALLALVVTLVLPLAFPVVDIGDPVAPVGTVTVRLTDESRTEQYGPTPGGPRQLAMQIWYPASSTEGLPRAPWVDDLEEIGPLASEYLGFPSFFLSHLAYSETGSYAVAPVADGVFPVIVYSHGWAGLRSVAFDQPEALAADGYIVVAVDHTYGALGSVLSDGSVAALDPRALPDADTVTREEYAEASHALVLTFADDILFVFDELETISAGDLALSVDLAPHMDLENLGVFAHSTGGGGAVVACGLDARCDALLGFDPWLVPLSDAEVTVGVEQPFASLNSEAWAEHANVPKLDLFYSISSEAGPRLCIEGTAHRDFTLLPRLSPLAPYVGLGGTLGGERTSEIVNGSLLAFFDEHLRNEGQGLAAYSESVPEFGC